MTRFAVASLIGAFMSVLADLVQKNTAGAVQLLAVRFWEQVFHVPRDWSVATTVVMFIAIGVALAVALEPLKRPPQGLAIGLGVCAICSQVAPYNPDIARAGTEVTQAVVGTASAASPEKPILVRTRTPWPSPLGAVWSSIDATVEAAAPESPPVGSGVVRLYLAPADGREPDGTTLTFRDARTRAIVNRATLRGTAFRAVLPHGDYILGVDSPGYRIVEHSLPLPRSSEADVVAHLRPARTPLGLQHLLRPLWGACLGRRGEWRYSGTT